MIRLIIFDLDGTLVDAYPAICTSVNHVLHTLGFNRRSSLEIKRAVGFGDRHLMVGFVGEQLADRAMRLYRPHHARTLATLGRVKFLPGAKQLLVTLKRQGYTLAVASNRPTRFTTLILKTLGARKFFDVVLCGDRVPKPKPFPDMLLMILKQLRASKMEALYVGDMTIDVRAGQRVGIKTVAVSTGSSSVAELKTLKPYRIISKIAELKTIIKAGVHT